MSRHRPMTRFATNAHFRRARFVTIRAEPKIFSNPSVVARGTHHVPRHSPPGPMTPLSRAAVFRPINIEPLGEFWIEGQFACLKSPAPSGNQILTQGVKADYANGFKGLLFSIQICRY